MHNYSQLQKPTTIHAQSTSTSPRATIAKSQTRSVFSLYDRFSFTNPSAEIAMTTMMAGRSFFLFSNHLPIFFLVNLFASYLL